jgi:UDP-2,3-diacylglucosamine pyrophosphatase LpxH
MSAEKRLTKVFEKAKEKEIPFDDSDKFILFSDCHRGDNSWADEFTHNHNLFLYALQDYFSKGFTYIEVGDGDELWENAQFKDIRQAHSDIFSQMKKFHQKKRFYLIWGNHDIERKDKETVKKTLYRYYDRPTKKYESLFEGIELYEGLILRHSRTNKRIFLVHGHQVDPLNDCRWLWRLNWFLHRYFWKYIQLFGIRNPASPAKYFNRAKKINEKLKKWAETNHQMLKMLIAGHTHSYSLVEPPYFNIGSCVHPHCITGIEIENGKIRLIEWRVKIKETDRTLYADKIELSGDYPV